MPTCRLNSEKNQLYQAVMEIIVKANENQLKEGKRDMCNALLELMKDELDEKREEGIREGIKEGESLGENRINQLILKLSELNRTDEILKAAADREYQKKLLKEFGLYKPQYPRTEFVNIQRTFIDLSRISCKTHKNNELSRDSSLF